MISRRAVAMRRERASVLNEGRMDNFESGAQREEVGVNVALGARVAVGSKKDVTTEGTDFVRWKAGAR